MNEDKDVSFPVSGGLGKALMLFNIDGSEALHVDVWVEALADKWFWQDFLKANDKFKFNVRGPDEADSKDGKRSTGCDRLFALEKQKVLNLGKDCIFCIDSDDSFVKGMIPGYTSKKATRPHVYVTNIYAIDNAFLSGEYVDHAFTTLTTVGPHLHNLLPSKFIKMIAMEVWDTYTGIYYLEGIKKARGFGLSHRHVYDEVEKLRQANVINLNSCAAYKDFVSSLSVLKVKVKSAVASVGVAGYEKFIEGLAGVGVTADTFFLFMRGHNLFDAVTDAFEKVNKGFKDAEIARVRAAFKKCEDRVAHIEGSWLEFPCYLKAKFSPDRVEVPFLKSTLDVLKVDYSLLH